MEGQSTGRGTGRRVTMREAAEILGVSVEAIRKRVQRKTIPSDKGEDGRRYVYLDTGWDAVPPGGTAPGEAPAPSRELVEEMRGRIEDLREQLAAEREAHREARRIIAGLVQRVPELEAAPQRSSEPPLSAEEEPPTSTPQEDRGGPEASVERPQGEGQRRGSWWRRILGG